MSPPSMDEAASPASFGRTTSSGDALAIRQGRTQAQAILARGSKSFALAGVLLGAGLREDAAVLYAWYRLADDRQLQVVVTTTDGSSATVRLAPAQLAAPGASYPLPSL